MFRRLENKYFKKRIQAKVDYPKVHLEGIAPILYTLAGGSVITVIIFVIEIVFNWIKTMLRKRKLRRIIVHEIDDYRLFRKSKTVRINVPYSHSVDVTKSMISCRI